MSGTVGTGRGFIKPTCMGHEGTSSQDNSEWDCSGTVVPVLRTAPSSVLECTSESESLTDKKPTQTRDNAVYVRYLIIYSNNYLYLVMYPNL